MTIPTAFVEAAAAFGSREAFVADECTAGLPALVAGAAGVRDALRDMPISDGDRVAIMLPNSAAYVWAFVGVLAAGGVCVPIDPQYLERERRDVIRLTSCSTIITSTFHGQVADGLFEAHRTLVLDDRIGPPPSVIGQQLDAGARRSADSTAAIFLTSGTTALPKATQHSHRGLLASTMSLHRLHAMFFREGSAAERIWRLARLSRRAGSGLVQAARHQTWMTPMSYAAIGGHEVLFGAVLGGHRLIASNRFDPRRTLDLVQRHRVNILALAPPMAQLLVRLPRRRLRSLLVVGLGGGPVTADLVAKLRERFRCEVTVGYGTTELGGGVLVTRAGDRASVARETVGKPFPGAEVAIVDSDGQPVADGTAGELVCMSPGVMENWDSEHASFISLAGSRWYRTGDIARKDAHGDVQILGRQDELIIRSGNRIAPREIEEVIEQRPDVQRAAVIGVGPFNQTEIWAFVEPTADATLDADDLVTWCREQLASFKRPNHVRIVHVLPATRGGEVQRYALRALVD